MILLKAFLNFFVNRCCLDDIVKHDRIRQLKRSRRLREEREAKPQEQLRNLTVQRMRLLRISVWGSLSFVLTAASIGFAVAVVLRSRIGQIETVRQVAGGASIVLFAAATLGRLGWKGQSLSGDTVPERLDRFFLWLFYWLATFSGVTAIVI